MQRDGELDGSERCAGVAANARHGFENVITNLVGYVPKLFNWKRAQVGRRVNTLKKTHCGRIVLQSPFFVTHAAFHLLPSHALGIAKYSAAGKLSTEICRGGPLWPPPRVRNEGRPRRVAPTRNSP